MSDPIVNHCEELFSAIKCLNSEGEIQNVPRKMRRVQKLLSEILKIKEVSSIQMNIDSPSGAERCASLKVGDFVPTILKLFEEDVYSTPSARLIITR
jgi:hypothetical protein